MLQKIFKRKKKKDEKEEKDEKPEDIEIADEPIPPRQHINDDDVMWFAEHQGYRNTDWYRQRFPLPADDFESPEAEVKTEKKKELKKGLKTKKVPEQKKEQKKVKIDSRTDADRLLDGNENDELYEMSRAGGHARWLRTLNAFPLSDVVAAAGLSMVASLCIRLWWWPQPRPTIHISDAKLLEPAPTRYHTAIRFRIKTLRMLLQDNASNMLDYDVRVFIAKFAFPSRKVSEDSITDPLQTLHELQEVVKMIFKTMPTLISKVPLPLRQRIASCVTHPLREGSAPREQPEVINLFATPDKTERKVTFSDQRKKSPRLVRITDDRPLRNTSPISPQSPIPSERLKTITPPQSNRSLLSPALLTPGSPNSELLKSPSMSPPQQSESVKSPLSLQQSEGVKSPLQSESVKSPLQSGGVKSPMSLQQSESVKSPLQSESVKSPMSTLLPPKSPFSLQPTSPSTPQFEVVKSPTVTDAGESLVSPTGPVFNALDNNPQVVPSESESSPSATVAPPTVSSVPTFESPPRDPKPSNVLYKADFPFRRRNSDLDLLEHLPTPINPSGNGIKLKLESAALTLEKMNGLERKIRFVLSCFYYKYSQDDMKRVNQVTSAIIYSNDVPGTMRNAIIAMCKKYHQCCEHWLYPSPFLPKAVLSIHIGLFLAAFDRCAGTPSTVRSVVSGIVNDPSPCQMYGHIVQSLCDKYQKCGADYSDWGGDYPLSLYVIHNG